MALYHGTETETQPEGHPQPQEDADEEYAFREQVGMIAEALDAIRYEDSVEYTHSGMAQVLAEVDEEFEEIYAQLEENHEQFGDNHETYQKMESMYQELVAEDDLPEEASELMETIGTYMEQEGVRMEQEEERMLEEKRLREKYREIREYFDDIKYNGESESGPGAFVILVDGPAEEFAEYANEKKEGEKDAEEDGTEWESKGIDPTWDDEQLAQLIYDTMERNDGAIVVGEDGFLPKTYWVPDTDAPEDAYVDGGTKHDAAVNAVYNGEVEVESLILSETDGAIRWFREDETPVKFAYDEDEERRTPEADAEFWYPDGR